MFLFEQFSVYQRANKLYADIITVLRRHKISHNIFDQLERALLSIPFNIAEGCGKYTRKDKRRFYLIARGSCHEAAAIVNILSNHRINAALLDSWHNELVVIGKMLTGMIKKFENNKSENDD